MTSPTITLSLDALPAATVYAVWRGLADRCIAKGYATATETAMLAAVAGVYRAKQATVADGT